MFFFLVLSIATGATGNEGTTSPYIVRIRTDRWNISPTSDSVYMRIIGSKGTSRNISLTKEDEPVFNRPNKVDSFRFDAIDVGILKGVQVTKIGFDRFLWSEIIVKTPKWTTRLNELDSYNEDISFDRIFYVTYYKGCEANHYWNREVCQKCPINSCSFYGSLSVRDCHPSNCLILDLEKHLVDMKSSLETHREKQDSAVKELKGQIENLNDKLSESAESLAGAISRVGDVAQANAKSVGTVSQTLKDAVAKATDTTEKRLSGLGDLLAQNTQSLREVNSTVREVSGELEENTNGLDEISNKVDEHASMVTNIAGNLATDARELSEQLANTKQTMSENSDLLGKVQSSVETISSTTGDRLTELSQLIAKYQQVVSQLSDTIRENGDMVVSVQEDVEADLTVLSDNTTEKITTVAKAVSANEAQLTATGIFRYVVSREDLLPSGAVFPYHDGVKSGDELEVRGLHPGDMQPYGVALLSSNGDSPLTISLNKNQDSLSLVTMETIVNDKVTLVKTFQMPKVAKGEEIRIMIAVEDDGFEVTANGIGETIPYHDNLDINIVKVTGAKFCSQMVLQRFHTPVKTQPWAELKF